MFRSCRRGLCCRSSGRPRSSRHAGSRARSGSSCARGSGTRPATASPTAAPTTPGLRLREPESCSNQPCRQGRHDDQFAHERSPSARAPELPLIRGVPWSLPFADIARCSAILRATSAFCLRRGQAWRTRSIFKRYYSGNDLPYSSRTKTSADCSPRDTFILLERCQLLVWGCWSTCRRLAAAR
jgi:hypothetical protein